MRSDAVGLGQGYSVVVVKSKIRRSSWSVTKAWLAAISSPREAWLCSRRRSSARASARAARRMTAAASRAAGSARNGGQRVGQRSPVDQLPPMGDGVET